MWCSKCRLDKNADEFNASKQNVSHPIRQGRSWWCKLCTCRAHYNWRTNNPEKHREVERVSKYKNRYGLSREACEQMLVEQSNCCAICRVEFGMTCRPELDHDHKTKRNRGWLCHACNVMLGQAKDDVVTLQRAIEYLIFNRRQSLE